MTAMRHLLHTDRRGIHERDSKTRMTGLGRRLSEAALGILLAAVPVASAKNATENAIDQAHVAAGHVWYDTYCASCHGPVGGPGSAVYRGTDEKADLRSQGAVARGVVALIADYIISVQTK